MLPAVVNESHIFKATVSYESVHVGTLSTKHSIPSTSTVERALLFFLLNHL